MKTYPTKWNFSTLFNSDDDPKMVTYRKQVEEKYNAFISKWKDRDDYLSDPQVLLEALGEYNDIEENYASSGKEIMYLQLRSTQEQNNPKLKAKLNKLIEFLQKLGNEFQFFDLRLSRVDKEKQKEFLNHPDLQKFRFHLHSLFKFSPHLLSEPEEKIMNLKSTTAYSNWTRLTDDLLSKEQREVLTEDGKKETKDFSTILSLLNSSNKKVRDSANTVFNDILYKYVDIAEAEYNSILGNKKTNDMIRGYKFPYQSRHLSEDLDDQLVQTLIDTVKDHFPHAQKYYQLKAKLFKVDKLAYHERNVPYGEISQKYTYSQSVELVKKVFSDLDPEFLKIFESFLANGQIDALPQKGKGMGAFCMDMLKCLPTYVMLNHTDKLQDVLTLAHEMGHAINSEYYKKSQPGIYIGHNFSMAEVSSTYMEDFVLEEIMKNADDELKLSLYMMKLNEDVSTIHRQIAFNLFEREAHSKYREQGYLSHQEIGELFQKYMAAYMGDGVEQSEGSANWWIYVGHFRRYFYNYQYSCGQLVSKAMQRKTQQNPQFIEKVKEYFRAGDSGSPKDIFAKMGIDITTADFWKEGLKEVEDNYKQAEKLAKKLGEI